MTLENILLDCKKQLNGALNHKKHPFRYFTLASISENDTPNLRTVVLREFNANKFQLSIFTDARSKKVEKDSKKANKVVRMFQRRFNISANHYTKALFRKEIAEGPVKT